MRLLANEYIGPTAVALLRAAGHDVLSAKESLRGQPDQQVLARAVADQRVLLTFDKDFGELAFRSKLPAGCGVVLFRITHVSRVADAGKIVEVLQSRSDWPGHFATVTDQRIRIRPLP